MRYLILTTLVIGIVMMMGMPQALGAKITKCKGDKFDCYCWTQ